MNDRKSLIRTVPQIPKSFFNSRTNLMVTRYPPTSVGRLTTQAPLKYCSRNSLNSGLNRSCMPVSGASILFVYGRKYQPRARWNRYHMIFNFLSFHNARV